MSLTHQHTLEKNSGKSNELLPGGLPKLLPSIFKNIHQSWRSILPISKRKKVQVLLLLIRRLSPLLLMAIYLPVFFAYEFVEGNKIMNNTWLTLFVSAFIEVNVLFTDFTVWHYFEGKKIIRIWLVEIILAMMISVPIERILFPVYH